MEDSIYELVVDELVKRQRLVREELTRRFKKTRPFREEPSSPQEKIAHYNMMTYDDLEDMIDTKGESFTNDYIKQMEELKNRSGRKIWQNQ